MKKFRGASLNMVVATDVAARGLDVKDIALVINYDFPTGASALYTLFEYSCLYVVPSALKQTKVYTAFTQILTVVNVCAEPCAPCHGALLCKR
jgi:Helicase conserved C-terminal domain